MNFLDYSFGLLVTNLLDAPILKLVYSLMLSNLDSLGWFEFYRLHK